MSRWTLYAEVYIKELKKALLDDRTEPDDFIRTEGIIEGIEFCLKNAHKEECESNKH